MALIRINPTKMLVGGDKLAAQNFLGPARSQMEILKNQMSFQNLSQGVRRVWLNDDVYVECRKIFNHQECRIWVRPEEDLLKPVYYYVRILCKDWYSVMEDGRQELNSVGDRKMDRIIIWKCREEVKGDTPPRSYVDNGAYEDGTKWWVKKAGAVILDVDVENEIVYSGSGGVAVQSSLDEDTQLAIAKKYISMIEGESSLPKNYADEYLKGTLFSPHALSSACNQGYHPLEQLGEPLYFDDYLLSSEDYGTPIDGCSKFYHMNQYAPDIMYWMTPEECPGCQDPDNEYLKFNWPKLDINRDKYRPTQREIEQFYIDPIGGGIPCGTLVRDYGDDRPDERLASALRYLSYSPEVMCGNCSSAPFTEESENIQGFFYTTNNTYPCFFISELGVAQGKSETRFSYSHNESNLFSDGTCSGDGIYVAASISLGESAFFVQTPLEEILYQEFINKSNAGCPCYELQALYSYFNGSDITIQDAGAYYKAQDYWGSFPGDLFYENHSVAVISSPHGDVNDKLQTTLSIVKAPDKEGDLFDKKHIALSIYVEKNGSHKGYSGWSGQLHELRNYGYIWCNGEVLNTATEIEDLTETYDYSIGMIFYILHPSKDTWTNEITGEKEYWDIHSERELSSEEINHNRLLDLEDYVNQILKELKDLPGNIVQPGDNIYNAGEYKWLEHQQGYNINTGFIYQLH